MDRTKPNAPKPSFLEFATLATKNRTPATSTPSAFDPLYTMAAVNSANITPQNNYSFDTNFGGPGEGNNSNPNTIGSFGMIDMYSALGQTKPHSSNSGNSLLDF